MFKSKHSGSPSSTGTSTSKVSKKDLKMQAKDPMSGRPGHLDPGQEHTMEKFRDQIQEQGLYNPERHDEACRE